MLRLYLCTLQATCDVLAEKVNLLPLLHQLEAVSSGSTIGPLAESLLEELQEAGASPVEGSHQSCYEAEGHGTPKGHAGFTQHAVHGEFGCA